MQKTQEEMENKMDAHTQAFINDARALRGEMRQMGQCLQAGKMATPRAGTGELKGSAPAGEDRVIRETCRVTEKVTETVTRTLKGEETCTIHIETRETMSEVTELTEMRETVVERLHGVKGDEDAHTHTHTHTHTHR